MNPVGTDGRTITCKYCEYFHHLIANCPDAMAYQGNVNVTEDEHAILFTGYNKDEIARLGVDARNCAVLDSACSSTVCGKIWLDGYLKSLEKVVYVKWAKKMVPCKFRDDFWRLT